MRGISRALILLAGLALSACATSSEVGVSTAPKPRAERRPYALGGPPTYTLGERWIRNDGVFELIRIEEDLYVFSAEPGREVHLNKDLALVRSVRWGSIEWELDPPQRLDWPLEVGKRGSVSTTVRAPNRSDAFPATLGWAVEAYEDIQLFAGTFKAFRISFSIEEKLSTTFGRRPWGGSSTQSTWKYRVWYAPEVRQLIKVQGEWWHMEFQVVSVDPPETVPLEVALVEPKDQARVPAEGILVAGKVTSGKGVTRVTVTLNGEGVTTLEERGAPKKEVSLGVPVALREGKNILLVTAVDSTGATRQEARTLFYEKPVAPPAARFELPPVVAKPTPPPAPPSPPPVVAKPAPLPAPAPVKPPEPGPPKVAPAPVPPPVVAKPIPPSAPTPVVPPPPPAPVVAALPPLQLTLSSPKDQARLEHETVGLAGLVSGGKGVSRVIVTLNGTEVSRLEERTPQPALAVDLPLKLREGQNTLVVTATEADGRLHQEVRTVHYEKLVPLTVAFRYPQDGAQFTQESSVVAAVVTSSKGVAKVSVTLNGTEVHQQSERASQKSVLVTVPVALREGANAIGISAGEPDGTTRQEVRTVIYEKPKIAAAVPSPPPAPAVRDRWAVVIGVGKYESPEIPRLRYTVPDAEAIYQILTGPAGFKKEHILLLTDKTEKKPTLRNIKWALGTFLARSAKKDDTVVIFFAGHGAPEVDPRGIERDGLAKYLAPMDAEPDDLYSTALPMDEIQTIFGRIEAERVVVFLDSCYSGAAGGRTFASKKTRASHVDDLFLERLTRAKGRAIITASRPAEVSIELPELGHGLFTYFLVQGLKGAADLNRDGIVSLQELYEYVEQQVTQKSRAVGGNQHPVMKGELEGVLPLVKVKGR